MSPTPHPGRKPLVGPSFVVATAAGSLVIGLVCALAPIPAQLAALGVTVSFEDGTVREGFLSWKAFQQLLRMKAGITPKTQPAVPANGPPAAPKA